MCCSLFLAGGFLIAFLLSVKRGAMDEAFGESVKVLFEEEKNQTKKSTYEY
jgi:cbb3-type cytochrome oxidase maturation protein